MQANNIENDSHLKYNNKKREATKKISCCALYFLLLLCEIHLFNYSRTEQERERASEAKLFCQRQCRKFCAKQQSEHHQHTEDEKKSVMWRSKIKYAYFRYSSKAQSSLSKPIFKPYTWRVWANVFAYMRIVIASYVVEGGARVRNCERMHEISMRWVRSVKLLSRYCSSHSLEFVCHWNVKSSKRNFTFSSLKKNAFAVMSQ